MVDSFGSISQRRQGGNRRRHDNPALLQWTGRFLGKIFESHFLNVLFLPKKKKKYI